MHPLFNFRKQATARLAEAARWADRRLDRMGELPPDEFVAKITAYDTVTQSYTWLRQRCSSAGVYYDDPSGLAGSPSWMPLKERNGFVLDGPSAFPHYALIRRRGYSGTSPVYEFDMAEHREAVTGSFTSGIVTPGNITTLAPTTALTAQLVGYYYLCAHLTYTPSGGWNGITGVSFTATAGAGTIYPNGVFQTYTPTAQRTPTSIGAVLHVTTAPYTVGMRLWGSLTGSGAAGQVLLDSPTVYLVSV